MSYYRFCNIGTEHASSTVLQQWCLLQQARFWSVTRELSRPSWNFRWLCFWLLHTLFIPKRRSSSHYCFHFCKFPAVPRPSSCCLHSKGRRLRIFLFRPAESLFAWLVLACWWGIPCVSCRHRYKLLERCHQQTVENRKRKAERQEWEIGLVGIERLQQFDEYNLASSSVPPCTHFLGIDALLH